MPASAWKMELVAPEEIDEAIRRIIRGALAIAPEDVPAEVGRLFGFARVGEDAKILINLRLQMCMAAGSVLAQGSYVALP